mgnify:CR=1 FL=1
MIPVNMGEDWRIRTGVNLSFPPEKPSKWLTGTRESIRKTNDTGAPTTHQRHTADTVQHERRQCPE